MKLLARWSAAATNALARSSGTRRAPPPDSADSVPPSEDEALPLGCGWFESSHELGHGLQVTEHEHLDHAGGSLPLDVWLAWHLAGFSADAASASSRTCTRTPARTTPLA